MNPLKAITRKLKHRGTFGPPIYIRNFNKKLKKAEKDLNKESVKKHAE